MGVMRVLRDSNGRAVPVILLFEETQKSDEDEDGTS